MELWRPDWNEIMGYGRAKPGHSEGCNLDDNELITITRGTARHAQSALRQINGIDYYHNNGAAERELIDALREIGDG